jgi:GT2 family glycosyltransferase
MTTIAVLLTCYNRKQKTLLCLECLYGQYDLNTFFGIDVFLVDDGSTDGTTSAIEDKYPQVNIIKGNGNLFWNRGMNLAWKTAVKWGDYDTYLWLNDDTFLFENALCSLVQSAKTTSFNSIICGATTDTNNTTTYGGFKLKGYKIISPTGKLEKCDYFNGNCVLIPKEVTKKVGMLDSTFHHALGDIDYGLRATKIGVKIYTLPEYAGTCEGHEKFPNWRLHDNSVIKRIRTLYTSSCDTNPLQFFVFDRRHFGTLTAIKHFFSINLRALMPSLWKAKDAPVNLKAGQ